MSKTPKPPSVPAPQFVIFDPPIPGFEARAEMRVPKEWEHYIRHGRVVQQSEGMWTHEETPVLTPVKRIEDLLPNNLKCEAWASQEKGGVWPLFLNGKPDTKSGYWAHKDGSQMHLVSKHSNPFGLPVEPNPQWRETLYKFTPGQGWRKCEVGK